MPKSPAFLGEKNSDDTLALAERAAERMHALLRDLDINAGLRPYGVKRGDLPLIAERAASNARLIGNNPRPATAGQILTLLESSYL